MGADTDSRLLEIIGDGCQVDCMLKGSMVNGQQLWLRCARQRKAMKKTTATKARPDLRQLSDEDRCSLRETLYLLSIPGMRESIQEGIATPVEECTEEIKRL